MPFQSPDDTPALHLERRLPSTENHLTQLGIMYMHAKTVCVFARLLVCRRTLVMGRFI